MNIRHTFFQQVTANISEFIPETGELRSSNSPYGNLLSFFLILSSWHYLFAKRKNFLLLIFLFIKIYKSQSSFSITFLAMLVFFMSLRKIRRILKQSSLLKTLILFYPLDSFAYARNDTKSIFSDYLKIGTLRSEQTILQSRQKKLHCLSVSEFAVSMAMFIIV